MEKLIEKLYEETYGPKIMPQDLLQNLKLENYNDIRFNKEGNKLFATVLCELLTGEKAKFEYTFVNDKLDSLIQISPEIPNNVLYNRETEIKKLRGKINNLLQTKSYTTA